MTTFQHHTLTPPTWARGRRLTPSYVLSGEENKEQREGYIKIEREAGEGREKVPTNRQHMYGDHDGSMTRRQSTCEMPSLGTERRLPTHSSGDGLKHGVWCRRHEDLWQQVKETGEK